MALEFPSWLEWMSWLVGSTWPHGNEDTMWQMARDLESVAGQADDLLQDLDHLLGAIGDAYPDGTGGDEILKWLKPLRYGDDSGHGSVKEFGDNYRQLSTAADGFGDQLQAAKLNFYIAGGWLVAELAWAAATGPFAPESEAAVISIARVTFRRLGEMFADRIAELVESRITNALLREILPKLIYEIGQGAVISTVQATAQELLVESIQNLDGHGHGFDWNAIGKNALVAGLSGGAGGAIGFGAHSVLPTGTGGWKGAFNGMLTGATAGVGGAGAGWLANGLVNGDWEFDPRTLAGGAFAGAGPSGLHGYNGESNHAGRPMGSDGDGSARVPGENGNRTTTFDHPGTAPDGHTTGSDANGNGHDTSGDPNADRNGGADETNTSRRHSIVGDTSTAGQQGNTGDSTGGQGGEQSGGPSLHPASATTATDAPPTDQAHDQSTDHSGDSTRSDNNGSFASDGRRERQDANAEDTGGATDSGSHRPADTATSGGDHTGDSSAGDSTRADGSGAPEYRAGDGTAAMDPAGRAHDTGMDSRTAESTSDHSEPVRDTNSTAATNFSNEGNTRPGGEPGKGVTTGHTGTANNAPETRAPAADPARATGTPRDPLRTSADGSSPKPVEGSTPKAPDTRAGVDRATRPDAPVQATRTGLEPTAHLAEPNTGGDHEQHADAHAAGPDDFLNLPGDTPRPPVDHDAVPHDRASRSQDDNRLADDRGGLPRNHRAPDDRADSPGGHPEVAPFVPIPVDAPPPADRSTRAGDGRRYEPAAAGPVGDFHGNARSDGDLTPEFVHGQIQDNLRLITPEGVAWNPDERHFVLSDGRIVRIEVGPTSDGHVAEFAPSADGYDVRVSNKARDEDVVRALAHELAEIRLSQDDDILIDTRDDRPTRMSTHLGGRFAELRVLAAHIDRAVMDPARAAELPRLRHDLHDLRDHLGFRDPAHAPTVERLLAEHDPGLARRMELERAGVLTDRPAFDPHLTEDDFRHAAENHLDRLRELMTGDHAADLVRVEEHGLNGRMREELSRRVFEPLFEAEAKAARRQVPGLLPALDPINAAINHPSLRGPEQAAALHRAIDEFHDGMPQAARDALGADRFARMHAAADAFETAPDRVTGVIDHATGRMKIGSEHTTLANFLHGIDRANRAAAEHGLNVEYTVVLHDAVDGLSTVEVLPRPQPQHRLPLEQYRFGADNEAIEHQPRPSVPAAAAGGHTIDVGVGRGAFAVEMTPAADRAGGGLIIKTELADAAIGAQRRRDLGILDAGPLMEPGTVMVYGDMLGNGHLLGGDIARVFINNVSADLPEAAYHGIAEHLSEILAPGGRVEIQWDMKPDTVGGEPGSRKHILGTKLWEALETLHRDGRNPFTLTEREEFPHPGNRDYYYTIDAGSSNALPHERMAEFSPPQPEHRWTISRDVDSPGTHETLRPQSSAVPTAESAQPQEHSRTDDHRSDNSTPHRAGATAAHERGAPESAHETKDSAAETSADPHQVHPSSTLSHDHSEAPTTPDTKPVADLNQHPGGVERTGELITAVDGRPVQEHVDRIARERADKFRAASDSFSAQPGEKPIKTQKRVIKAQADGSYVGVKSHGSVTATVVDLRTGIAYEGANGGRNEVVPKNERHPTLQANIDAMKAAGLARPEGGYPNLSRHGGPDSQTYPGYAKEVRPYPHFDRPWGHAEVKAANAALWARERANVERREQGLPEYPTGPEALAEMYSQTYKPFEGDAPRACPYCANCNHTMGEAHNFSGRYTGFPSGPDNLVDRYRPSAEPDDPVGTSHADPPADHGTASPVGEFRGDARPGDADPLTRESLVDKVEHNLRLIEPADVAWNHDAGRFEMAHDARTLDITVDVGPTTGNAVAEFTAHRDESGRITGYDIHVSPHARDEDVVRAVAHELAEIRLAQDDDVVIDPVDDRPTRMTSHLGGRFAELRVLVDQIGDAVAARAKDVVLAPLRRDLDDLMYHLGLHDPEHAPTVERLLAQHDPGLARLIDQARIPDSGILRPGPVDHDATPTAHDLGRIRQLRELAERAPDGNTHHEALALVERLGLREGTPGAADRRAIIADHLTEHARRQVADLLADVGRRESELPAADRDHAETVRLELRAADALDYLSIPFHKAVMKAHMAFRAEMAVHLARTLDAAADAPGSETGSQHLRLVGDHMVEDVRSGEKWFRWPPGTDESPEHTPVPDVGLPTDPDHRLPVDPRQLYEAWQRLSPAEKDAWHAADPFIGNRDGIPQSDRDIYNRKTLEMLWEQARLAQDEERLAILRDMKENYLDLPTPEGMPAVHLSYLDEKLQYIYALGNPDTAQNIAVELAGAFRRRSGVGYALETLAQVRQAALAIDPTAETSVILFGAYHNPNSLVEALHSGHAEDGAAKVREFHDGLRVTHQGPPANTTTIAHSYGGVTGGHAAGHGHELNTDALVFLGSWGTGAAHVGDLRLTGVDPADIGEHVFATMAEHDSIQLMPPTHGPAPSDPAFGARVFESGTAPSRTRLGWNPDDHVGRNYFSSGHQSFRSLGLILTGNANLLR